ncbi:Uncharacterized protein TCM_028065 [Theobroma cacao]|uniref:Transmembrane protein n=1 Tax=Theobroma cacao TaxID=3641 RepID=A0A061GBA7_THECC|nr:Uncharacterized protein TCM_028065 [Theobroma cacao]
MGKKINNKFFGVIVGKLFFKILLLLIPSKFSLNSNFIFLVFKNLWSLSVEKKLESYSFLIQRYKELLENFERKICKFKLYIRQWLKIIIIMVTMLSLKFLKKTKPLEIMLFLSYKACTKASKDLLSMQIILKSSLFTFKCFSLQFSLVGY